jgi:hypothetical protein
MARTTLKTLLLLSVLLRNLATDYLPRICLRGNLFTKTLPSNGCTCNNILFSQNPDWPCDQPNLISNGCCGLYPPEVEWPGRGSDHSHLVTRLRMHDAVSRWSITSSWHVT